MEIHKYNVLRENSKRHYNNIYYKHISPELGNYRISEITQLQIKYIIKQIAEKGLKFETQNKVRIMLQDMFDKAMIDSFVRVNPAKGISVTRTIVYQKLDGDEKKEFHIGPPKTKTSVRKVPMNDICEQVLNKQILQKNIIGGRNIKNVDDQFKDLLFTTRFNTPLNAQNFLDAINKILDEINLMRDDLDQFEKFSSHTFRHTFATRCFESGIEPKTVQSYLGHATLQMTMDLYTHVMEEHQNNQMEKLNRTTLWSDTLRTADECSYS